MRYTQYWVQLSNSSLVLFFHFSIPHTKLLCLSDSLIHKFRLMLVTFWHVSSLDSLFHRILLRSCGESWHIQASVRKDCTTETHPIVYCWTLEIFVTIHVFKVANNVRPKAFFTSAETLPFSNILLIDQGIRLDQSLLIGSNRLHDWAINCGSKSGIRACRRMLFFFDVV